jgi:serine-type D-Ala-D-Ala carboxypeptidase/endopeptidase (penicillin-binding protein 4)
MAAGTGEKLGTCIAHLIAIFRIMITSTFRLQFIFVALAFCIMSCSVQQRISKTANATVLGDSALKQAHIGISIFDPSSGKYLYNYNGSRYFVPASNTKIVTCYAAMKFLGDSLPGIKYTENNSGIVLFPTGDPTLLHPDFPNQPVIRFLKNTSLPVSIVTSQWNTTALGSGWGWGDYNFYYSPERSPLPVYGNIINWVQEFDSTSEEGATIYSIPEVNWKVRFNPDTSRRTFYVQRNKEDNVFIITEGKEKKRVQQVPFVTNGVQSAIELLKDTIGKEIEISTLPANSKATVTIASQPTDSVLKPMMYRSDNFFAEQLLLMAAHKQFGILNEDLIIDSLLKSDLKDLPQRPGWADGSGLSRFNLFTPQDFVVLLDKMQKEFGMERLQKIFPTGGTGTLSNYYKSDSGYIFAKTGSLNGVLALSGYMYTKKGKLLIFSTLINNHRAPVTNTRRQVEKLLTAIRNRY